MSVSTTEVERAVARLTQRGKYQPFPYARWGGREIRPGVSLYQIDNATDHNLTIWFTGPEHFKVFLEKGGREEVEFKTGYYNVYAEFGKEGVLPSFNGEAFSGQYHVMFHIGWEKPKSTCPGTHSRTRTVREQDR